MDLIMVKMLILWLNHERIFSIFISGPMSAYFFNVTKTDCDSSLLTDLDACRAAFSSSFDAETTLADAKMGGAGWIPGLRRNPWRHTVIIDFWTRRRIAAIRVAKVPDAATYRRPRSIGVEVGVTGKAWRRVGEAKYPLTPVDADAEVKLEKAVSARFVKLVFNDEDKTATEKPLNIRFDIIGCTLTKTGGVT